MSDLPPIPDEAVSAACRVGPMLGPYSDAPDDDETWEMLAAAWPHLYAAALRHAADQLPPQAEWFKVTADANERRLVEWCADRLRRLADQATP